MVPLAVQCGSVLRIAPNDQELPSQHIEVFARGGLSRFGEERRAGFILELRHVRRRGTDVSFQIGGRTEQEKVAWSLAGIVRTSRRIGWNLAHSQKGRIVKIEQIVDRNKLGNEKRDPRLRKGKKARLRPGVLKLECSGHPARPSRKESHAVVGNDP